MNYSEKHEFVCDSILDKNAIKYFRVQGSVTPYYSNDLGDKVDRVSGPILSAYIRGDDQEILKIIQALCDQEIDSLIDLVWG